MDLRYVQKPLKDRYRADPGAAHVTLRTTCRQDAEPTACSIEMGRTSYPAEAHVGVGGPGTGACSGDLLLGALAACAQITCQMVAEAMGIPTQRIEVSTEGDLDLRGTLGLSRDVPVGFGSIRMHYRIEAPDATADQISALKAKTEQYCVVMQTLRHPPEITVDWISG